MFSIEEFILAVFCWVDELVMEVTPGTPIRQKEFAPALAEREVLTMESVAEDQGAELGIWQDCRRPWLALFPPLAIPPSWGKPPICGRTKTDSSNP